MFNDLVALFSGWYSDFVSDILLLHTTEVVLDGSDQVVSSTSSSLSVWSAFVPWEHIISAVVFIVMIVSVFKFLRAVLCKIL